MPSNKILVVFIFCIAVVLSTWLLFRNSKDYTFIAKPSVTATGGVTARPYIETSENDDWKKMLSKIEPENQAYVDLTANKSTDFDETTITAQVAKDYFSQYLLAKQGGKELTQQDIEKIAQNISSTPQYLKSDGAVYISANLHTVPQNDLTALKKYKNDFNLSSNKWSSQIKDNPLVIVSTALQSDNQKELEKLDPLITIAKGFISDFLKMEVPPSAVSVHLAMLNSFSDLLSDLEAMRVVFEDPIRAAGALGQYGNHMTQFNTALQNMNMFLLKY